MTPEKNTVLVLDDDPFQHKAVSYQLKSLGVDVTCFFDGAEVLKTLDGGDNRGLLILVDLEMPEMDGVEFVRHLVQRDFNGAVAIMSGQDLRVMETVSKLANAHRLKFMGCLEKPVQPSILAEVLERWRSHDSGMWRREVKKYDCDELRRAIACDELMTYYQPKVNVRSGVVSGMESLVRWQHPDDGLVFPDQFIDVAEEHGLIEELTRIVLRDTLEQASKWHKQNILLRVAVNVSMDNLKRIDFPDYVQSEIRRTGVDPKYLILEVTESRLMDDARLPLDILARLRLKQISLSIDDFGTGHSSLAQLRDMPFDELKIDRSFVHGADKNKTLRSIFEASLTMASQLGMKVVAEGVEDRDDWNFLIQCGCDLAQGYFIARPMPASDFPAWFGNWSARKEKLVP